MAQLTDLDLADVVTDLRTIRDQMRDALPVIVNAAAHERGWPDTMLSDVAAAVAEGVGRLDAVVGLLVPQAVSETESLVAAPVRENGADST